MAKNSLNHPNIPGSYWLLGTFLTSATVINFELALTRLFSAILWYHFVFVVVSVTILGLALGSLFIYRSKATDGFQRYLLPIGGGSMILALIALTSLPLTKLWPLYLVFSLPPFFFFGAFQTLAFKSYDSPGKLYFADLMGAALSSISTIWLMKLLPVPEIVTIASGLIVIMGLIPFNTISNQQKRASLIFGGSILTIISAVYFLGLGNLDPNKQWGNNKQMYHYLQSDKFELSWTRWNELSRIDVVDQLDFPDVKLIFTDGASVSSMYRFNGDFDSLESLKKDNGYFALANGKNDQVAIVGAGGGKDILISLMAGAKEVTAIEINPGVIDAMRQYRDFNGNIYERPEVRTIIGDGRNYLERSDKQYDVIYLPLVMMQAADGMGLGLVENYAFTKEAFRTYLNQLTPEGRLVFKLHDTADLNKTILTALQVLSDDQTESEAQASKHLYILMEPGHKGIMYPVIVIEKTPISRERSQELFQGSMAAGFSPIYFPYHREEALQEVANGSVSSQQIIANAKIDYRPSTDERPFFYNRSRGLSPSLRLLLMLVATISIAILMKLQPSSKGKRNEQGIGHGYFAALGVAFMLIEIVLIQKSAMLLSMPTVAAASVISALLIGGAIGSFMTSRIPTEKTQRFLPGILGLVAVMTILYGLFFKTIAVSMINLAPSGLEPLMIGLVCLPMGFFLGMPFPIGLRILKLTQADQVPAAWAVNGVFSVLGSVGTLAIATISGYSTAIIAGGLIYGVTAIYAGHMRRRIPLTRSTKLEITTKKGSPGHQRKKSNSVA